MLRDHLTGGLLVAVLLGVPLGSSAQELEVPPCEDIDPIYWQFIPECEALLEQHQPVIVVPGLLASYNKKLLFRDQPGGSWSFVPLDSTYRGLIQRLEAVGYEQGTDLFIGFYDWRQSNAASATEYLKPLINHAKAVSGADQVDIIAHSMGGLVARGYIQGDGYENDVDQLIMLGTPNTGAADAYVAWEGGFFPDRWGVITQWYVEKVERSLKKTRNLNISRPASFREFFPSLQELLPIDDMVNKANALIPHADLAAPNQFLIDLAAGKNLLEERGVRVATIAGTGKATINQITVDASRTTQDTLLDRWRDGHANPDPPVPDSIIGDETVLLHSAHISDTTTDLPNVSHVKLPEAAQDQLIELLGITEDAPQQFHYEPPQAIVGWVVLSPLDVTITGPQNQELSKNNNHFGEEQAVYDDDPTDPDDPKVIVIADPPPGEYTIELTGTDSGEYTVITTYADQKNDVRSSERHGVTATGQHEEYSLAIAADGTYQAPSADVVALLNQLPVAINHWWLQKHITPQAYSKLWGSALRIKVYGERYHFFLAKDDHKNAQKFYKKLQADFKAFSTSLDQQITQGEIDTLAAQELIALREQLASTGL